jgi:hypothetical protein
LIRVDIIVGKGGWMKTRLCVGKADISSSSK